MKNKKLNIYYPTVLFFLVFGINSSFILFQSQPQKTLLLTGIAIQSLIVTTLALLISMSLQRFDYHKIHSLFILACGLLLVLYEGDVLARRFSAAPLSHFIYIILTETDQNAATFLEACAVSWTIWIVSISMFLVFIVSWLGFYKWTDRYKKWNISIFYIFSLFLVELAIWPLFDFHTVPYLSYDQHAKYQSYLPLRQTLLPPSTTKVLLPDLLPREIASLPVIPIEKKPPIFLFVLESVGAKYIDEIATPYLNAFRENNISFEQANPGGNATMLSWFSLFHSQYSLRWSQESANKMIPTGSLSLQHLKALGYKIHLYSAANLSFYQLKESIFGKNGHLADTFFSPSQELEAHERDTLVMQELIKNSREHLEDGHLYVIFLDSPHFGYSWPEEKTQFSPCVNDINLLKAAHTKQDREKIFNRYRNSIYHVDSLLGEFFGTEKSEDSVIIITGDHGEEFYDQDYLFHASNLSKEQVQVPLYLRLGKETAKLKAKASSICSHVDIFPTLLDYLGQGEHPSLDGESIFKKERWPFTITSKGNGSMPPYEFCIQNHNYKMILHSPALIPWVSAEALDLLSLKTTHSDVVIVNPLLEQEMTNALGAIFSAPSP